MSHQDVVSEWTETVCKHMPHLSRAQARVLALFSFGMVLARSCAVSAAALSLSPLLGASPNTVRQRLREFCYPADAKRGAWRTQIDTAACFAPLLSWILSLWQGNQLALALDATYLKDRFIVLCISVLYRGAALPVAWTVLSARQPHAGKPEWQRLLNQVHGVVPKDMDVIVLADRGLYARCLFLHIARLGWHPLLRVHARGSFRPQGAARSLPFKRFAPAVGTCFAGAGTAFSSPESRLPCTLFACWDEGHDAPWLLLTDLSPDNGDAVWYGLRAWIERGFKNLKSGGFQWQYTRMDDTQRAERLWLCAAVATLWLLSTASDPPEPLFAQAWLKTAPSNTRPHTRLRPFGIFRLGLALILAALIARQPLPKGRFIPDPWPTSHFNSNHSPITYP